MYCSANLPANDSADDVFIILSVDEDDTTLEEGGGGRQDHLCLMRLLYLILSIYIALRKGSKRKLMKITTISCCAKREQLHNLLSSLGALSSLINTLLL